MAALSVVVNAFDADDRQYTATFETNQHKPVSDTLAEWATLFNIPVSVVGFEDDKHNPVSTTATPSDLGWKDKVQLQAVPLNDEWADAAQEAVATPPAPKSAKPAAGATAGKAGARAAAGAAAAPAAPAPAAAAPAAAAPAAAALVAADGAAAARAGKKRPAPAAPAAPAAPVPPAAGAKCPQDDEAVLFMQENPKRAGTGAHTRYEKYKVAKTPREALALGAVAGDIVNDFKKGYLRRP